MKSQQVFFYSNIKSISCHHIFAVVLAALLVGELLLWSLLAPVAQAGGGFALEGTQLENRALLEDILRENEDINLQTEQMMEDTADLREFWREDNPAQWEANIAVIEEMVEEVIEFAQSGFDGNPAFVTDLTRYIENREREIGDRFLQRVAAGDVIDLPYREAVVQAGMRRFDQQMAGQLDGFRDGIVNRANLEAFFRGDVQSTGGLSGFLHMTQQPTAMDAFFRVQGQLNNVIRQTIENDLAALNWSDGFLSTGECQVVQGRQVCDVNTPGSVIASVVNQAIGTGFDTAIAAQLDGQDLDNAIFGGLRELADQVLDDAAGLLNMNDMMAGLNIESLLNEFDLENIIFDLIQALFGPEDEIVDDTGRLDPAVLAQARESIDTVFSIQDEAIAELGRLGSVIADLSAEEAEEAIITVLGRNYNTFLDDIDQNYARLFELSDQLDNISAEATRTGRTEVQIFRTIMTEVAIVQNALPNTVVVGAWRNAIDQL